MQIDEYYEGRLLKHMFETWKVEYPEREREYLDVDFQTFTLMLIEHKDAIPPQEPFQEPYGPGPVFVPGLQFQEHFLGPALK